MQIAYFVNQYPKVSHSFIRREILALERLGHEVHRYALRGWQVRFPDREDVLESRKTVYLLRRGAVSLLFFLLWGACARPVRFLSALRLALRVGRRAERPLPYHLASLAEACALCHWLRVSPVSHVHAHFGTNSAEVVMLAQALGGPPYSFTVHGPEEFDKPGTLHLAEKVRRSAFVVAISSYGRSQLFRWVDPLHWDKVRVVHCGLDQAFHDVELPSVPEAARLVCVGRLCAQKGQLLLVEAARLLHARGIRFELVLAGDGEMRPEVERAIADAELRSQVRITGWIGSDQVREELLAARALVLPSFAEGLPVVIMEAMALARPVLSTYIAGIPELVRPQEHGWLIPAGEVTALCEAMQEVLEAEPQRLHEMGQAGRARVLARHDADREASRLADYIRAAQAS